MAVGVDTLEGRLGEKRRGKGRRGEGRVVEGKVATYTLCKRRASRGYIRTYHYVYHKRVARS